MEAEEIVPPSGQNLDISFESQKIIKEIKSLEKELEEIQNSCHHSKYSIKNTQTGSDKPFCLKRICDFCQADVGYPTQEEFNKWINS